MHNDYKSLDGSKHKRVNCEGNKRIVDDLQESVHDITIHIPCFPCRLFPSILECRGGKRHGLALPQGSIHAVNRQVLEVFTRAKRDPDLQLGQEQQ